jgi:predicted  nucleic acid-binding Zn-ribbon protein
MDERLNALYELQKIDLELAKLQKMRGALDDGSAKKEEVAASRRSADEAEKLLRDAASEMQDKDLNLKSVEAKRKTFKERLYAGKVTNPKELSSMEKEIEQLGRQKDTLEERILELMDVIEELKKESAAARAVLESKEKEHEAIVQKYNQDLTELTAKTKALIAEREKAAAAADPALLKRYETMRTRLGILVISKVEDGYCSACRTSIPGADLRDLKTGKEIITCENCGRILYLENK